MWKAIRRQIAKRFFGSEFDSHGSFYVQYMLRRRRPITNPEAECTPTAREISHLMAVPAEIIQSILQYPIADSIIEVRQVQMYKIESAIRIIDFPTGEAVNAGGPMPATASSLLRVNKILNQGVLDLLALPDVLFCPNPDTMGRLMKDMGKVRDHRRCRSRSLAHIHIRKIICTGGKYEWDDPWIFLSETDEEAVDSLGVFVTRSEA